MRGVVIGLALAAAAALYVVLKPSYQTPLGVSADVVKEGSLRYRLVVQPYFARYEPGREPAVIVILPPASEVGKPPMRSVQLSAVGPTVGEVWLDDAEVRGNTVVVKLSGKFGQVLDDWVHHLGNATGVEPSIHVHIWYGDEYWGFAFVNYDPHKLAKRNTTYVVKAQVITSKRPTEGRKPASHNFGLDCAYEWRYSFTVLDTEKDLGGRIPVLFLYNQYSYSGEVGLNYEITIGSRLYISGALALGHQIGDVDIKITDLIAGQWDIKDNTTTIKAFHSVSPEKAYWVGVYGRLTVDRYDEWQVCRDGGRVVGSSRTGKVMYKTNVYYFRKDASGKTLVFSEGVSTDVLNKVLELRNYYKLFKTITAEVSTAQSPKIIDLGNILTDYVNSQCPSLSPSFDTPLGIIAVAFTAVVKGVQFVKQNPWLAAIPLSIDADYKQFSGIEYKAQYQNYGGVYKNGYNVVEYVDLYVISSPVKISDNCVVDLPVGYVISR